MRSSIKQRKDESEIRGNRIGTFESQALAMIQIPNGMYVVAFCSVLLVVLTTLCLIFVPWQQTVSGRGKVVIFHPMQRPMNLEAAIPGRIKMWFVRDGQWVNRGDPIVELLEVDEKFLAPNQLEQMRNQRQAYIAKMEAARCRANSLQEQLEDLKVSRKAAVGSADRKTSQAGDRLEAAKLAVTAAKQNLKTSELNFNRVSALHEKGLRSRRDLELSELELIKSRTDLERAEASLEVSRKDTQVASLDLSKTDADTSAQLNGIEASYNSALETVATTQGELRKLEVEISHLEARIPQRLIRAPIDGRIVRLLKAGAGETVQAGTKVAVIAPNTTDLAAELLLDGNDAPLVLPGRPVRLQFAGWPAVQFTGWPSVAVGTFAGRVAVVDAVDDGTGKFRIIVVPDEESVEKNDDQPWPGPHYLRPGSEAQGWVMLNTVSLGFELWRQFNGFPPALDRKAMKEADPDIKRKSK
ncbi:MAG: HlyD family efflux transporter periplasmic adaptor subunit [Candidatus Melainabacteria bacterium]|nr:HlyD family efflux transporter periplasmic adaptor subunit [Candidatus Melainabacteria bacterium]